MSKLKMTVYTAATGVEMTIAWGDEEEYQAGKKFLLAMGALNVASDSSHREKPESFCLENKHQLESLFEFRRSLRERRNPT